MHATVEEPNYRRCDTPNGLLRTGGAESRITRRLMLNRVKPSQRSAAQRSTVHQEAVGAAAGSSVTTPACFPWFPRRNRPFQFPARSISSWPAPFGASVPGFPHPGRASLVVTSSTASDDRHASARCSLILVELGSIEIREGGRHSIGSNTNSRAPAVSQCRKELVTLSYPAQFRSNINQQATHPRQQQSRTIPSCLCTVSESSVPHRSANLIALPAACSPSAPPPDEIR